MRKKLAVVAYADEGRGAPAGGAAGSGGERQDPFPAFFSNSTVLKSHAGMRHILQKMLPRLAAAAGGGAVAAARWEGRGAPAGGGGRGHANIS